MKSSNSILLLSSKNDLKNQTLSIKVPHNYGILPSPIRNTNQNQINTTKRHNQESQQVSKENNVIYTKDKVNKIMNKLSKKLMLEDYLFIKSNNNKRDLPILKRGSSVDYNGISGMSHNSNVNANVSEKKRMMLPITIHQKMLNKFDSPKFVSQLHHYTKALKHNNNKVSCNSKQNNSHKDNSVKSILQSGKRKKSASVQEKGNKK